MRSAICGLEEPIWEQKERRGMRQGRGRGRESMKSRRRALAHPLQCHGDVGEENAHQRVRRAGGEHHCAQGGLIDQDGDPCERASLCRSASAENGRDKVVGEIHKRTLLVGGRALQGEVPFERGGQRLAQTLLKLGQNGLQDRGRGSEESKKQIKTQASTPGHTQE